MRRVIVRLIAAIAVLAAALSCERRPLYDLTNTHYVRVYVDEELLNVTTGFYDEENNRPEYQSPQVIRIVLADPETGAMKADRYLRNRHKDAKGTYYDGFVIADPGIYDVYAYNFDTEATLIRDAANYDLITAYTNEIASHLRSKLYSRSRSGGSKAGDDERIVYDADHLFVSAVEGVTINYSDKLDTLYTPEGGYFEAESVVKSYYIQVKVKGMKYVSSAVAVLGGMAGSVDYFARGQLQGHCEHLFRNDSWRRIGVCRCEGSEGGRNQGRRPGGYAYYVHDLRYLRKDSAGEQSSRAEFRLYDGLRQALQRNHRNSACL